MQNNRSASARDPNSPAKIDRTESAVQLKKTYRVSHSRIEKYVIIQKVNNQNVHYFRFLFSPEFRTSSYVYCEYFVIKEYSVLYISVVNTIICRALV